MSTEGQRSAAAQEESIGAVSLMSTEGQRSSAKTAATPSLMSTEGSKSFVASMGDSYAARVDSFSVPSVRSVAASSVDVDQMYEEYYATNSATSSVSHL